MMESTELMLTGSVEETAFELWALKCNRRMDRVKRELSRLGHTVDLATLNAWAKEGEWAIRVRDNIERFMPEVEHRTWTTMALGGEEAADYLREAVRGNFFPELETPLDELEFDPAPLARIRVEAAKQMLLMTGWSPNGGLTKEKPFDPGAMQLAQDLKKLTPEQLFEREQAMIEKSMAEKRQAEEFARKKRIRK
jgi:hypothetical protein